MKKILLAVVGLTPFAAPALAGIADSPLPVLVAGQTTQLLYSVPGVVSNGTLESYFACTSTDTATMTMGIEVFGASGGDPVNDAAATAISVLPGGTVRFGTHLAISFTVDRVVHSPGDRASARILSTSKKLECTAFVADPGGAPPGASWQLTIIAKTKQKAAN